SLVREPSGNLQLHLSHDFFTKHAPELYVYLVKLRGQQRIFWKEVGLLKGSEGGQAYSVGSDATKSGVQVAIFCAKCNQISGRAPLAPVPSAYPAGGGRRATTCAWLSRRSSAWIIASTQSGSNWVPDPSWSSLRASCVESATR